MLSFIYQDVISLTVPFLTRRSPCYVWILWCGNILLTITLSNAAKVTTLTPLSQLISCKLSFPVVGLKIPSLPNFVMKSRKKNSYGTSGMIEYTFQFLIKVSLCILLLYSFRAISSHQRSFSVIYDILLVTNSTLLIAYLISWCTKRLVLMWRLASPLP